MSSSRTRPIDRPHPAGTAICCRCRVIRFIASFDGKQGGPPTKWCLVCRTAALRTNRTAKKTGSGKAHFKKHHKKWLKSFAGWIYRSWGHIKLRTGNLGSEKTKQMPKIRQYIEKGITLQMSKNDFYAFCFEHQHDWDALVAQGKKPSIDRINPAKGYSVDNIRILDTIENIRAGSITSAAGAKFRAAARKYSISQRKTKKGRKS